MNILIAMSLLAMPVVMLITLLTTFVGQGTSASKSYATVKLLKRNTK